MRLCEHPDFDQAVLRAADHFRAHGLRAAVVEKDYFVTEALRAVAAADLRVLMAAEFERQCRLLCFGPYPARAEVESRFETLRPLL